MVLQILQKKKKGMIEIALIEQVRARMISGYITDALKMQQDKAG